jgi:uncharacterized protein YcfJ
VPRFKGRFIATPQNAVHAGAMVHRAMEMTMKRVLMSLGLGVATLAAGAAHAGWYENGVEYDWARVVAVDPIIDSYETPVSRDVCWNEPVEYYEPRYVYEPGHRRGGDGTAGALLGAIVGGALGNQVGNGDGRRAATIAGAVIGGAIGHDRATGYRSGGYREVGGSYRRSSERVCDTRVDYRRDERVVGYDVTYLYNGREYRTQTDAHPGDRIRVAVTVAPAR